MVGVNGAGGFVVIVSIGVLVRVGVALGGAVGFDAGVLEGIGVNIGVLGFSSVDSDSGFDVGLLEVVANSSKASSTGVITESTGRQDINNKIQINRLTIKESKFCIRFFRHRYVIVRN